MLIQRINTITFYIWCRLRDEITQVMLCDQVQDKPVLDDLYIGLLPYRIQQCPLDLLSCNIFVMQYPEFRMTAFLSQLELTAGVLIKTGAPVDDLLDPLRSFLYDD